MKTIDHRRSVRKYTSEPVPSDVLQDFVKAGMNAPSAGDQQPWHFVVITERSLLDPHAKMLREAPAAIVVCGDPSLEKHKGYWVQDCSAATENILLEIADRGYGGVWLGCIRGWTASRGCGCCWASLNRSSRFPSSRSAVRRRKRDPKTFSGPSACMRTGGPAE